MNHESPWGVEYANYFVTICCRPQGLNQLCWREKNPVMVESIENYHHQNRWFCSIALWMPDHLHMIIQVNSRERFSDLIGDYKRYLSKKCGVRWHRGFFDHRIRRHESLEEKWRYIENNPVRAGLVRTPEEWAFRWEPKRMKTLGEDCERGVGNLK